MQQVTNKRFDMAVQPLLLANVSQNGASNHKPHNTLFAPQKNVNALQDYV